MYDRHYGERQVYAMLLRKTDGRVTIRPDVPELQPYVRIPMYAVGNESGHPHPCSLGYVYRIFTKFVANPFKYK